MNSQKPQTLERRTVSQGPEVNPYEKEDGLEATLKEQLAEADEAKYIEDPTGEIRRMQSLEARNIYRIPEKVEVIPYFPASGEFVFSKPIITPERPAIDISANTISKVRENTTERGQITVASNPKNEETLVDYLKANVDFGIFFKATKEIFKLGFQTVKELRKTTQEAATVRPDGRTQEQRAQEAEKKQKQQTIQGNINRAESERARVQTAQRTELAKEEVTAGIAGMNQDMQAQLMGENYNISAQVENSKYAISEKSKALAEFQKRQQKQQKQAEAQSAGMSAGDLARSQIHQEGQSSVTGANASAG